MSFLYDYYIQPKNQQMIWNTLTNMEIYKRGVNTIPQFEMICIETFKSIIEQNYTNLKAQHATYTQGLLQHANRETLRVLVEVIQKQLGKPHHQLQQAPPPQMHVPDQMVLPPPTINDIYESRKTEYSYSKPNLPEKNPFELEKDEPITNIDELIEKHRREREDPPQPVQEQLTDNKYLLDIQRQLGDMRNEIAQLKKEIETMKRL
jgi:hypothetical protein